MKAGKAALIAVLSVAALVTAAFAFGGNGNYPGLRSQSIHYDACIVLWHPSLGERTMNVSCTGNAGKIDTYLNPPDALRDTTVDTILSGYVGYCSCAKLDKYSDLDFELILNDGVSEKRYPTTRYELPPP